MANEIKADDIFDSKGFDDIANNFDKVIGRLEKFISEIKNAGDAINKNLTGRMAELAKLDFSNAKDIAKFNSLEQAINKERQRSIALEIQLLKLKKELNNAEANKKKVIDITEKARKASANSEQADLAKRQKAIEQQRLADIRLQQQREKAFDAYEKKLAKQMQDEKKAEQQRRKLNSEYNKTQIQLTRLNRVLRDLEVRQAKGIQLTEKETAFLIKYTKVQKDLDGVLKKTDATLGIHNRNVGNYTESIKDALNQSGLFGGQLQELQQGLALVRAQFQNTSGAAGKFGAILKGAGIGTLIAILGSLKNVATSTGQGFAFVETQSEKLGSAVNTISNNITNELLVVLAQLNVAYQKVFGSQKDYEQAVQDLIKKQQKQNGSVTDAVTAADEYIKALQRMRTELAQNIVLLGKLEIALNDINQDVNDQTLSIETRTKKERESLEIQRQILSVRAQQASKENEVMMLQVNQRLAEQGLAKLSKEGYDAILQNAELTSKLLPEQIKQIAEAQKNAQTTLSEFLDIDEYVRAFQRRIADRQLAIDLELIRNKKLVGKSYSEELLNQIEDEKTALDQRVNLLTRFTNAERELSNKSLDTLQKAITKRLKVTELSKGGLLINRKATQEEIDNINKLKSNLQNINLEYVKQIKSANELEVFVNSLSLNEEERVLLQKEIVKLKEIELTISEDLKKIDEARVKLIDRITELEIENVNKQREQQQKLIADEQSRIDNLGAQYEQAIEKDNYFNFQLINQRKQLFDDAEKLLEEENKSRLDELETQSTKELDLLKKKKEIEARINSGELTETETDLAVIEADAVSKELLNIETEREIAIFNLKKEYNDKKNKLDIDYLNFIKKTQTEQIKIIAGEINKVLDFATEAQSKKFEQTNENIQKEIERNNTALDSQRARAEQGLSNELAFRQAQSDKLALIQEREKKRQEKSQELLAYLKLFTGYAEQNPDKALQFTLRDMALMTAGKMLYANEGNEFVSADGKTKSIFKPFAKGADVVPAMLAEGERVVTKDKNIKYNEALHAIHNDKFNEMYLPKSVLENGKKSTGFAESALNSMLLNGLINVNSETNNRIANLEKAILSKEHTNFSWNEIYGGIQKEVEKAGKKTTTIYKVSKPRIN